MREKRSLRAPFPWFGGKSRVARIVWSRFGDTPNYVEPFAGSLATLLRRPHWPWSDNRIETINDKDCYVANFWRALQAAPDEVAQWCDWPANEADLHARHVWLVNTARERVERLMTEPDYYDAKVAGWWVWGQCLWLGGGWCAWHGAPAGDGMHRPSRKRPCVAQHGVQRTSLREADRAADPGASLRNYLAGLAARLLHVRIYCGDWSRVCTQCPTHTLGQTAVFLDPPYADTAERTSRLYAHDSLTVAHDVREWAIANADNPLLRIALCGYEGEHQMPDDWECVAWKAHGGYAIRKTGRENARRERIWFSPHCLRPRRERRLFD